MRTLTFILCLLSVSAFAEFTPEHFKKLKELAEKGEAYAQHELGLHYYAGFGVSQDLVVAAKWFRKSAEQGYDPAQTTLGHCYNKGQGVKRDPVEAYAYFNLAQATNRFAKQQLNGLEDILTPSQIEAGQKRSMAGDSFRPSMKINVMVG